MRKNAFGQKLLIILTIGFAVALAIGGWVPAPAGTHPQNILIGQVSSIAEGAMEGVLVSAKKIDGKITVTVVTDARGRYGFPADKLDSGTYVLTIGAAGYELADPVQVDLNGQQNRPLDLKLRKTDDLAAQLTNTEWFISFPGTAEQKRSLLDCMGCHTLERIVRSTHTADEFVDIIVRMAGYANMTTPSNPQKRMAPFSGDPERFRKLAEFLSTVNLSKTPVWSYPLKPLPRPSGRATKVVITEYDMPRNSVEPHDIRKDANGKFWFSNFGEESLGEFNPVTGEVIFHPIPILKPGFPIGTLDLEEDRDGNYWLALMYQGGIAKFDKKTGKFQTWPMPPEMNTSTTQQSMVMPGQFQVDGKVWSNAVDSHSILRLDVASGKFETIDPFTSPLLDHEHSHSPYGLTVDSGNNLYFMDFDDENIVRIDAKTTQATIYPTPSAHSRPRRGMMDAKGRLWFAEYGANRIGMFDTKTERFREWEAPTPWTSPYDVFLDKNEEIWSGSMTSDRILRLNTKNMQTTEYLLPHETNIRRVFVDDSTDPVTVWVGNNHGASIVKIQPLD